MEILVEGTGGRARRQERHLTDDGLTQTGPRQVLRHVPFAPDQRRQPRCSRQGVLRALITNLSIPSVSSVLKIGSQDGWAELA